MVIVESFVYGLFNVLFYVIVIILGISAIVSQSKQMPYFDAMLFLGKYLREILKEKPVVVFPTGIGFDANGAFIPSIAEDEFRELKQMFEGLYLSNYSSQQDRYFYYFKYAKINVDMASIDLYTYTDKKVAAIVNKFVTRVSGLAEIEDVSAIQIEKGVLNISLARNPNGQQWNKDWKNKEYSILNEFENETKRACKPISIKWEDLII